MTIIKEDYQIEFARAGAALGVSNWHFLDVSATSPAQIFNYAHEVSPGGLRYSILRQHETDTRFDYWSFTLWSHGLNENTSKIHARFMGRRLDYCLERQVETPPELSQLLLKLVYCLDLPHEELAGQLGGSFTYHDQLETQRNLPRHLWPATWRGSGE